MAADNHTTIIGNLVDDPELRFTQNGIAVANLRVAVTQRIQQDGEWRDGDTSFLKVNVWRGQAENLAESLGKGDRVMVTGRLRQRSWDTPEGDKRSVTEIEADEVGASLKRATAKVERTSQRGNGDRAQGRERQAERGGDFNDPPSDQPFDTVGVCSLLLGSVGGHQPSPTSIEQQLSGAASARATDADRPSPHRHTAQPIVVLNSISIPPRTLPGSCQCHLAHRRSVPRHNSASWALYQPKPLHNNTRLQAEAHWWPIRAASETAPSTVRNRPPSDFLVEASGN
jgi:single-strand DNA-binding protein